MGVVQKSQLHLYWSQDPPCINNHNVVIARNRFQAIIDFLYFADKSDYDLDDPNHDRLYTRFAV